jgi:hypothetical protein
LEVAVRVRRIGLASVLIVWAGLLAALFAGVPRASAAAPASIKVSVVNGNAGTLRVTGSNFSDKANVTILFEQDGAGTGDDAQTFTVHSNGHGGFSATEEVYVTASCLVGVTASDAKHISVANINTTGLGCVGAQMQVQPDDPLGGYLTVTGTGFTPGSPVELDFYYLDTTTQEWVYVGTDYAATCGQLVPGPYPSGPAGQLGVNGSCTGLQQFDPAFCTFTPGRGKGKLIQVDAVDIDTDYVVPSIEVYSEC